MAQRRHAGSAVCSCAMAVMVGPNRPLADPSGQPNNNGGKLEFYSGRIPPRRAGPRFWPQSGPQSGPWSPQGAARQGARRKINLLTIKPGRTGRADQISQRSAFKLKQTFLLGPLARQFTGAAHRFGLFTGSAFRRLFKILPHFHFAEDAFALQFLLQGAERLIDVIVPNTDLYQWSSPSKSAELRQLMPNSSDLLIFPSRPMQGTNNPFPRTASQLPPCIDQSRGDVKR